MTWKDVALKLVNEFGDGTCLGEIFDEMSYLLDDEEVCHDCNKCLIQHIERKEK